MRIKIGLAILAAAACAGTLYAQPRGKGEPGSFRHEVRFQGWAFQNFYHAADPSQRENITAEGTEYRAAYRVKDRPAELFAHANFLHYNTSRLEDSYGGRLGFRYQGKINTLTTYVERSLNRPSFEVGNVFAPADITTYYVEHSVRVSPHWELAAEGRRDVQSFKSPQQLASTLLKNNSFTSVGGQIRYVGLGWRYTPAIGFRTGNFVVRNQAESYGDHAWYVQMAAIPRDRLYFSLRLGDRTRDYSIQNPLASNFGRDENRGEVEFVADYQTLGRLGYTLYYAHEGVSSNRPDGDFNVQLVLFGVSVGL